MRRMKAVLCGVLAAVLLAGCGGQGAAGGDELPAKSIDLTPYTVVQALYPVYPAQPNDEDFIKLNGEWDDEGYMAAWDAYEEGLKAIGKWQRIDVDTEPVTAFAQRTAAQVFAEGNNTVYSPVSLYVALAMLTELTAGDSRQQVMDLLGASDSDALRQHIHDLWLSLYCDDGSTTSIIGNAAFLNDSLDYKQEGLDVLADSYYAGLYRVPMGTAEADEAVQSWINQQTGNFLKEAAGDVVTDIETLLMLVNTLYYKAAWADEFSKSATREDVFTTADGVEQTVDFMHRTESYDRYLRGDDFTAASLSLRGGDRMVFVLPDEGVAPESLLQREGFLAAMTEQGEVTRDDIARSGMAEIVWSVPKFDASSTTALKDVLQSLGVADVFDADKADLSPLTDMEAAVTKVSQSARVKVDEQGVEAAAFTVIAADTAMLEPEDVTTIEMDMDRPFLFLIVNDGAPTFIGTVNTVL